MGNLLLVDYDLNSMTVNQDVLFVQMEDGSYKKLIDLVNVTPDFSIIANESVREFLDELQFYLEEK